MLTPMRNGALGLGESLGGIKPFLEVCFFVCLVTFDQVCFYEDLASFFCFSLIHLFVSDK